ncbi:MAG: ankyrin repeat domain-containing protein [Rubrivivax sp.]|nr:ankyrin repeat domain-containing protein [Rubrivivax sp.]
MLSLALLVWAQFAGASGMTLDPKRVFPQDILSQQLAAAAQRGDIKRLQTLVAEGGNVKAAGLKDLTLPHFALYAPNPDALVWLIQQGADPVSRLPNNATVPHYAVAKEESKRKPTAAWIEPLLKLGVSPDLAGTEGDYTLLVLATIHKNRPAIRALKAAGANMNLMRNPLDGTALHWALTGRDLDLAAELADLGVDPRIKQRLGQDQLDAAQQYCIYLSGTLSGPERQASFTRLSAAFKKWGLDIPCGF